jgi:hypothetical protein
MDCLVMFCGMMFAGIISAIVGAATPEIEKLTLGIAALEPMEALIHRFGCFWSHGSHAQSLGSDVVGGDHGLFDLGMTHFFKRRANGNGKFATVVEGSKFGFRRG